MSGRHSRTDMLIGTDAREKLAGKHVALFGLGGVGGGVLEALVRAGVGTITIVDNDEIDESNLNRQMIATEANVGMLKTRAAAERAASIDSSIEIIERTVFFLPETADTFDFSEYDYVIDAVDTVAAKIAVIERAKAAGVPVISAMGTGNKLHPESFEVSDIEKTQVCPLAKAVRTRLRKLGVKGVKVVYSKELPVTSEEKPDGDRTVGSISFVPPVCGMIMAGEVIKDLAGISGEKG